MPETTSSQPSAERYSPLFVAVAAVFVTCLITANVIAVKLIDVFGFVMPAGTVIFPLSYIFGDVLTEVYGYRQARRVIWLGFLCNLIFVGAVWVAQVLPGASFWDAQAAYERILGFTPARPRMREMVFPLVDARLQKARLRTGE